jgi:Tissue inhibitor of metalloproteinase
MRRQFAAPLRLVAALALVAGLSAVPIAQVAACSCMALGPEEAAQMADVAFAGTVVSEEVGAADPAAPMAAPVRYTFAVDGVAKGDVAAEVSIVAGGDSAMCGMTFAKDERWLVFGTVQDGRLTTGLCAGNLPLQPDEDPPVALYLPDAAEGATSGAGVPLGVIVPLAAVVALGGLAAFLFWRADRSTSR